MSSTQHVFDGTISDNEVSIHALYRQMSESPEAIATAPPARNTPWIGEFMADDGDSSYFIFVEQAPFFSFSSFVKALFFWFCLHYVFNLEYNSNVKEFCLFFQEFVFGLPNSCKKTSTYLSTTTDIQRFAVH